MMRSVRKMKTIIISVSVLDNGQVLIVRQVRSPLFLTLFQLIKIVLAPCLQGLCYNGGYCDDDGKGKDGCVCVHGWLGADCRASKNL